MKYMIKDVNLTPKLPSLNDDTWSFIRDSFKIGELVNFEWDLIFTLVKAEIKEKYVQD